MLEAGQDAFLVPSSQASSYESVIWSHLVWCPLYASIAIPWDWPMWIPLTTAPLVLPEGESYTQRFEPICWKAEAQHCCFTFWTLTDTCHQLAGCNGERQRHSPGAGFCVRCRLRRETPDQVRMPSVYSVGCVWATQTLCVCVGNVPGREESWRRALTHQKPQRLPVERATNHQWSSLLNQPRFWWDNGHSHLFQMCLYRRQSTLEVPYRAWSQVWREEETQDLRQRAGVGSCAGLWLGPAAGPWDEPRTRELPEVPDGASPPRDQPPEEPHLPLCGLQQLEENPRRNWHFESLGEAHSEQQQLELAAPRNGGTSKAAQPPPGQQQPHRAACTPLPAEEPHLSGCEWQQNRHNPLQHSASGETGNAAITLQFAGESAWGGLSFKETAHALVGKQPSTVPSSNLWGTGEPGLGIQLLFMQFWGESTGASSPWSLQQRPWRDQRLFLVIS